MAIVWQVFTCSTTIVIIKQKEGETINTSSQL